MPQVTISPKYQIVIPREIREKLRLAPGEKVEVFDYEGRIEFVPVVALKRLRGFLKGIDTRVEREDDRL